MSVVAKKTRLRKSPTHTGERAGQFQRACRTSSEELSQYSQLSSKKIRPRHKLCFVGMASLHARQRKFLTLFGTEVPKYLSNVAAAHAEKRKKKKSLPLPIAFLNLFFIIFGMWPRVKLISCYYSPF